VRPPEGATYPQILRGDDYALSRSIVGVAIGVGLFFLLTPVITQVLVSLFWATLAADYSYADYYAESFAFERPLGMLATNLGIATLIPISLLLVSGLHRMPSRWLWSVGPGVRWRYLLGCLVIAIVALNGVMLLSTLVEPPLAIRAQSGFVGFLVVILLTSPLQAVGEEVFFRGYLMQALGSMVAKPWFGVVVSAVVFALLHGLLRQNAPLFVDRLAFGLLAGWLVWRTGGLEAGIAAHVVNNVFAYAVAGFTTSIAELKAIREITWVDAGFDVGGFALFALAAYLLFRLLKLSNRVGAAGEVGLRREPDLQ
jgi:membrane protease YdiL (CAAX protease family)